MNFNTIFSLYNNILLKIIFINKLNYNNRINTHNIIIMYNTNSIWDETITHTPKYNNLKNNISTYVCIIGGGITGISTGYMLYKNSVDFVLLEKNKICNSTTKFSTAKITSQHGLIYSDIAKKYGLKYAKLYLDANNEAINNIKKIIQNEKIDCDFENQDSYIFTQDIAYKENINKEFQILTKLGFKDVEALDSINLPINTNYAIKFKNQAKFNPKKYCLSLADIIKEKIYENSDVIKIEKYGNSYIVYTPNNKIYCKKIVMATHFPIKDIPGFHFLKMYQETSNVIAIDIKDNTFNGMYINVENPTLSFRSMKYNNHNILLVGGNETKTGDIIDENKYKFLEKIARQMYPDCEIIKEWNTQDCITLDKIPYIGKFSNFYPNVYIATGFNKWGMTTSNIAANILKDKILTIPNKYEKLFNATRLRPIKNSKELYYNINQTIQSEIINKLKIKEESIDAIPFNTGKIIKENNINVGIYKDEKGNAYKVNPYCSHLNCLLTFNSQDKTWDCPCHGSRFDIYGNIINNPANNKI